MAESKKKRHGMRLIFGLSVVVAIFVLIWAFKLSNVSGFMCLILLGAFVASIYLALPVTNYEITIIPKKNVHLNQPLRVRQKAVDRRIRDENARCIDFSEFFRGDLIATVPGHSVHCSFYQNTDIRIKVGGLKCQVLAPAGTKFEQYFDIESTVIGRENKVTAGLITAITFLAAIAFCFLNYKIYTQNSIETRTNLETNLQAMTMGCGKILLPDDGVVSEKKQYYSELPDVHLLVITKEQNQFVNPDSAYYNPADVNTVLMFYEDNLSGKLNQPTVETSVSTTLLTEKTDTDTTAIMTTVSGLQEIPMTETTILSQVEKNDSTTYYNLTELYMNIPLHLEDDPALHMMGELFQGTVSYQGLTGYSAVKSWFKNEYHIYIASVTELPESIFAGCFGKENSMAVNLNREFVQFLYSNYCTQSAYYARCIQDMLNEKTVSLPVSLANHTEELAIRMGVQQEGHRTGSTQNAMLVLDGESIAPFANTVRGAGSGDSEYSYMTRNGLYHPETMTDPETILTVEQWKENRWEDVRLEMIVHSNWDILLANLLESITNLDYGTYQVLCADVHTDVFAQIRSSLQAKELYAFLLELTKASNVLMEEENTKTYLFSIRNLDLHYSSLLKEPNAYLLRQPLKIEPYTNKQISHSLYYCLREEKGGGTQ